MMVLPVVVGVVVLVELAGLPRVAQKVVPSTRVVPGYSSVATGVQVRDLHLDFGSRSVEFFNVGELSVVLGWGVSGVWDSCGKGMLRRHFEIELFAEGLYYVSGRFGRASGLGRVVVVAD